MMARILGIGAVTALGRSLQQTLAALDDREMALSRDRKAIGVDGLPMTLAAVWPLHDIHNPLERLARLATLALEDLAAQGFDLAQAGRFTLCLPAWVGQGGHGEPLRARLAERWAVPVDRIAIVFADRTSILDLGFAAQAEGSAQILIVAETYLVAELLDSLTAKDRILSRYQPHGLVPSEAGVALLIAPEGRGRGHAITALQRAHDPVDLHRPDRLLGPPLAGLADQVLQAPGTPQRLISDLNGERWRSEEIAVVCTRCADRLPAEAVADVEAPASQLGYSGAAMAGILLALACRGPVPAAHGAVPRDSLLLVSQFDGTRIAARVTGSGGEAS